MSRFFALLTCLILLLGLCIGVGAEDNTRATAVNVFATVSNNGSCDITTTVTLHVDAPSSKLTFPVPAEATNVTLNGTPVLTEKNPQARSVKLNRIIGKMSGDFSFTVGYSIPSAVEPFTITAEETDPETGETKQTVIKRKRLELPMLAGFSHPIDELQFSINLPASTDQIPTFVSGYHQANIEKDLTYTIAGNNIAGRSWTTLKDHETLVMYLIATDEMFPQTRAELPVAEDILIFVWIIAGLGLLYWILFLRNFLSIRNYPSVTPEGFNAGQMGTILTMAGADLALMVFSWAQLGYLDLHLDRRGKVFVMKRMDMGNERTAFEQKCFYKLFAKKEVVDTSSAFYQKLYQSVAVQKAAPQLLRPKGAGNVTIFRIIMAIAGLLSGTYFGIHLGNLLDYGWVFMSFLSCVGALCSWHIQQWPQGIFLHQRHRFYVAMIISVLWLILGIVLEQFNLALLAILVQFAAGFLAAFGGRRSEEGRMIMGQTLRLRRRFRTYTAHEIHRMRQDNPELFFDLAPFAIALGRENVLARRFGSGRLPICPYIYASNTKGLTAAQWCQLMRIILDGMTVHQRKTYADFFQSLIRNSRKQKF